MHIYVVLRQQCLKKKKSDNHCLRLQATLALAVNATYKNYMSRFIFAFPLKFLDGAQSFIYVFLYI